MFPLKDSISIKTISAVTWVIVAVNVLFFAYEISLSPTGIESFFNNACVVPSSFFSRLDSSQVPKLFTSMFTHAGIPHIVMNMWFLCLFGDAVEAELGPAKFLILYFLSGLVSTLVQVVATPSSTLPVVGASGAISGVLGSYWLSFPRASVTTVVFFGFFVRIVQLPAVVFLSLWFVVQLVSGFLSLTTPADNADLVGFWAHASGFVFGIVLTKMIAGRRAEISFD